MLITCPSKCASALARCACWGCWLFRHCNFVLPCDMSDALEISHVKSIDFSFLSGRKIPGLIAVQECAYSINFVYLDLSMFRQLDHTLFVSCLSNPFIQIFLKTKRIWNCRTQVHKSMDNIQFQFISWPMVRVFFKLMVQSLSKICWSRS